MSPTAEQSIATKCYEAFVRKDAAAMAAFYSDDVAFSDPVFTDLKGQDAKDMWRMLCTSGDLKVQFSVKSQTAGVVKIKWIADYTFSKTKRFISNHIEATLEIKDGKTVRHIDHFDFYVWARQAFGPIGLLIGWTPFFKSKVQKIAMRSLRQFQKANAATH